MNIIDKVILDVSMDERVSDGMFDVYNNSHMEALREYLTKKGIAEDISVNISNLILEKGKHPERQAYNVNGILVTFPTPEYKQRAIQRGTHFEVNPKVSQSNLFGGGQQAPSQPSTIPAAPTPTSTPSADKSTLPSSDVSGGKVTTPEQPQAKSSVPTSSQLPTTSPTATSVPTPTAVPDPSKPAQGQLAVEPSKQQDVKNVSTPAPVEPKPVVKSPKELNAEKQVIKQVFNSVDSMPTVPGVGGSSLNEQLIILTKFALDQRLNEAVKFLSNYI